MSKVKLMILDEKCDLFDEKLFGKVIAEIEETEADICTAYFVDGKKYISNHYSKDKGIVGIEEVKEKNNLNELNENIVCPCCGAEDQSSFEVREMETEVTCPCCGAELEIYQDFYRYFGVTKILNKPKEIFVK